jgi:hypothetical protein
MRVAQASPLGHRAVATIALLLIMALSATPAPAAAAAVDAPLELIVTPDTFVEELLPLKAWREQQGLRVDIATTTSIQLQMGGRDLGESIHLFAAARKAADPRFEYLLLFGDDPLVPGRLLQVANHSAAPRVPVEQRAVVSDLYYGVTDHSFFDLADIGPEYPLGPPWWGILDDTWGLTPTIHVGRVPASDEAEAAAYVSRIIVWEQAPPSGVWQLRTLLGLAVASAPNSGSWAVDRLTQDAGVTFGGDEAALVARGLLNISLRDYPDWPSAYDSLADRLSDAAFFSEWNLGATLVVLAGRDGPLPGGPPGEYGGDGTTAVYPPMARASSLDALSNGAKLPLLLAAYASSANFTWDNDMDIERALFAPGGGAAIAVGFTGATSSGTAPGGTLGGWRLASIVLEEALARPGPMGDVVDRARGRFISEARNVLGSSFDANNTTLRTAVAGLTLLGDPASLPWMGPPRELALDGPAGAAPNAASVVQVRVSSSGAPVPNATVAILDEAGDLVARGIADASGVASVPVVTGSQNMWTIVGSAAGFRRAVVPLAVDSPPAVAIITPGAGSSVAGPVHVAGSAGDSDAGDAIAAVEVSVNGGPWQPANGTASWSFELDTESLGNGPNLVAVRAFDGTIWGPAGSVEFVVSNPKPPTLLAPYPQLYVNEDAQGSFPLNLSLHIQPSGPGASLTATVEGADRVRASIEGDQLVVRPDANFNGAVTLALLVSDSYGGSLAVVLNLGVLAIADPPVLTVGGNLTLREGGTITFDPRAFDPDGTLPALRLELGPEGATLTGWQAPRKSAGNYTFVFSASDGLFVAQVNLVVVVEPYNGPPTATLTGPTRGEAGRELQFSAESPADPDGDPLTFRWDFGDGQHASGPSSSHVYATPGHYAVTLNMSDGRQSVSYTQLVLVDPYRAPGASPLGLAGAVAYVSAAVILACAAISGWMLLFGARRAGPSPAPAKESQGLFGKDDEEE